MDPETMRVVVLVKAAPVLTQHLDETMCVAGVRIDTDAPEWIRLHPVPFRDLEDDSKFAKYQVVTVDVDRPRGDRRPESWSPRRASIVPGESFGTSAGWAQRRELIRQLPERDMCELIRLNQAGSGSGIPSLAVVQPVDPPTVRISERDAEQLAKWRKRAAGAASRMSLFEDQAAPKPPFEVVPWRFQYRYRCAAPACKGHEQTIVDWEVLAFWRRVRHLADWRERVASRFERDLWDGRDSVLFVGNQEQHPVSFLVLGVFWPPAGPSQGVLEL
jgi:hypothetical protein